YLLITSSTLLEVYSSVPINGHYTLEKAVRQGIPAGSRASPVIASMLLRPSLEASFAASLGRVVVYGDDIAIGARSKVEAANSKNQLQAAMADFPGGPLFLKKREIAHVSEGFNFTKYRF